MEVKKTSSKVGILDRSIAKSKGEVTINMNLSPKSDEILHIRNMIQVSLSAFALLFSELVQYNQNRVTSVADLERK